MPKQFSLASQFTNGDLERALIAALCERPEVYFEVVDLLLPETFTEERELFLEVVSAIEEQNPLPAIKEVAPATEPLAAARELAELYQKRKLADLAQGFLGELRGEASALELIASLEGKLAGLQKAVRELKALEVVALPDLLPKIIEDVVMRCQAVQEKGTAAVGLSTGIGRLDKLLGGLQPGVHMLAGEPGQGKTSFVLQMAGHVAKASYPVLFISFEEPLERLAFKSICQQSGLEMKKFADGLGDPAELSRAAKEFGPTLRGLYLLEGSSLITMAQIKAKALQIMARDKAEKCLIIVDYLQRWASARRDFSEYRHVVSALVGELRELSFRLSSPIVVISSQNRNGQGTSMLTSLKESGDLEYSTDTALFLVENKERPTRPPARAVELKIEKNRYGDKGKVELIFKPEVGIFLEVTKI